jgi:transcriptional regulator with XRE-family HTH domain
MRTIFYIMGLRKNTFGGADMLGEKIKELLEKRGMRQTELARITGISKTTINSIIMRNNKSVDFSAMEKIADALGVPIEYFLESGSADTKKEPIDTDELPEKERRFAELFISLSPSNRHTLLVIAEALLRDQSRDPAAGE